MWRAICWIVGVVCFGLAAFSVHPHIGDRVVVLFYLGWMFLALAYITIPDPPKRKPKEQ